MSIEDVQYLLENSEKESFNLYVDSSTRDRSFFPKPNEYTVHFDQPFKYVYGVDVLDASIPCTSYNIEHGKNTIAGFTYSMNPQITSTFQDLITELSTFQEFDDALNSTDNVPSIMSGGTFIPTTMECVVTTFDLVTSVFSQLPTENTSHYLLFQRGIIEGANIFNYDATYSQLNDYPLYKFAYKGVTYAIINDPNNVDFQNYISILSNPAYKTIITPQTNTTQDLIYYQINNVNKGMMYQLKNVSPNILYWLTLQFFYTPCIPGNYSVTSFMNECKRALGGTNVTVNGASASDVTIQAKLSFTSSLGFVFNMKNTTLRTSLGFDEYAYSTETKAYKKLIYKDNTQMFNSIYNTSSESWNITAPGVIYLLGAQYCILKCKEIEDHLYGSLSYGKFSPGMCMFKLFAVNDFSHQRLDYVNFQKKPFHPIGKLDRLSLRFEDATGQLYDFKGANHIMMICVRYLVPTQKNKFTRSILNPNYHYDFNKYMARKIEYNETSDNEKDEVTPDMKNFFISEENKYADSSSEDDGSSTDDSEIDYTKIVRV